MALKQIGTTNTTTLRGLVYQPAGMSTADVATLNAALRDDPVTTYGNSTTNENYPPLASTGTGYNNMSLFEPHCGQLFIPSRGFVKLFPGDFLIYDPITGFPFVISGAAMAHNPNWVTT